MLADIVLMVAGLVALIFASLNDLRTREVPDWLNYGLIVSGFGIRLLHSVTFNDWWYLLYGVIGFCVMLTIGIMMYYAKQWGGGDAKLAMGLGVVFATSPTDGESFLVGFWINLLVVGALYGLFWSVYLALKHRKKFWKEAKKVFEEKKKVRRISLSVAMAILVSLIFIGDYVMRFALCLMALSLVVYSFLFILVKAVENVCMYKLVPTDRLTEGDWVAHKIYVKGRVIASPKDLGLEKGQIDVLKKSKIKRVLIKEGIPFVPSFLIAAVITLLWGNILFMFL